MTSLQKRPAPPPQLQILYAPIQREMEAAEARLSAELHTPHAPTEDVIRYGIRLGGKRLRPALLLLAGQATGKLGPDHTTLAVVVEMIHTATLVHDDVLDEAEIRRHIDTVNARWNNETSVLLGDFLFTHAFYLASTLKTTYACRTIGKATNTVCDGELRQTVTRGDLELSETDYFAIIEGKTAALCACCCELGAHYAGADAERTGELERFGWELGIAFQIADDILDLEGDEILTGKSLGTDIAKRKMTLPLIHARDARTGKERSDFLDLLADDSQDNHSLILGELEKTQSLEFGKKKAAQLVNQAIDRLSHLPDSPAKTSLRAMAEFVVTRSH